MIPRRDNRSFVFILEIGNAGKIDIQHEVGPAYGAAQNKRRKYRKTKRKKERQPILLKKHRRFSREVNKIQNFEYEKRQFSSNRERYTVLFVFMGRFGAQ